jgi:hypothetical protein
MSDIEPTRGCSHYDPEIAAPRAESERKRLVQRLSLSSAFDFDGAWRRLHQLFETSGRRLLDLLAPLIALVCDPSRAHLLLARIGEKNSMPMTEIPGA